MTVNSNHHTHTTPVLSVGLLINMLTIQRLNRTVIKMKHHLNIFVCFFCVVLNQISLYLFLFEN